VITVVGSSNTDMVVKSAALPAPGETVLGGEFIRAAGGKGANQAVAAARMGANVQFVGRVGGDDFGRRAREGLAAAGVSTDYLITDSDHPSGVALIMVDEGGENCISVAPGANGAVTADDVRGAEEAIAASSVVLAQLEVPVEAVAEAGRLARKHSATFILNPAPARKLPDEFIGSVDLLVPNETEAEMLAGGDDLDAAVERLLKRVRSGVILTMGSRGVRVVTGQDDRMLPAFNVDAVDTTAAGDAFAGALAACIDGGDDLEHSVRTAMAAAALSVTRMGAQPSMPTRDEVEAFLGAQGR